MARKKDPDWLSASELGTFVYSREAFADKIRGVPVGKDQRRRMQRGTRMHNRHGVTYDWQIKLRKLAVRFLVLAAAAGALFAILALRGI